MVCDEDVGDSPGSSRAWSFSKALKVGLGEEGGGETVCQLFRNLGPFSGAYREL